MLSLGRDVERFVSFKAGIMPWDSDFDVKLYTEQDITMEGEAAGDIIGEILGRYLIIWKENTMMLWYIMILVGDHDPHGDDIGGNISVYDMIMVMILCYIMGR